MIEATRFNGTQILLNPEQILYVETIPDTVVTMTTGEKVYVKEPAAEVQQRFLAYKRKIFAESLHGGIPRKKE
jgi:flagellar protein FlbD